MKNKLTPMIFLILSIQLLLPTMLTSKGYIDFKNDGIDKKNFITACPILTKIVEENINWYRKYILFVLLLLQFTKLMTCF